MKKIFLIFLMCLTVLFNQHTNTYAQTRPIFDDDFNNNTSRWNIQDGDRVYSAIQHGKLFLRHKVEGTTISWNSPDLVNRTVFTIEAVIQKISGTSSNYGLVFGYNSESNRGYFFSITHDNAVILNFLDQDKWAEPLFYGPLPGLVNPGNSVNKFTVVRDGSNTYFFLNDKYIGQKEGLHLYGYKVGFETGNDIVIEADSLKIYEGIPDEYLKQIVAFNLNKEPQINIFGVNIEPETVRAGGTFSLKLDYMVMDAMAGNAFLPISIIYSISKNGEVLFTRSADVDVPNSAKFRFKKDGLIATKNPGFYDVFVKVRYGKIEEVKNASLVIN